MIKYFVITVCIIFALTSNTNCQVPIGYSNYSPIIYKFEGKDLKGYDSLGRKQGYWEEYLFIGDYLLFYNDSIIALEKVFAQGFYIDDFKEGLWNIYDIKDYEKRKILAHIYFEKNVMIFQLTYINNNLHQFTRIGYTYRPSNVNNNGDVFGLDILIYDDDRGIVRKSYSPDGVLNETVFPRKPSQ